MALNLANLMKAEGFSNAPKLFTYVTTDAATGVVEGASYFDAAAADGQLEANDIILAVTNTGGTLEGHLYVVVSISATDVVVIKDTLAIHL